MALGEREFRFDELTLDICRGSVQIRTHQELNQRIRIGYVTPKDFRQLTEVVSRLYGDSAATCDEWKRVRVFAIRQELKLLQRSMPELGSMRKSEAGCGDAGSMIAKGELDEEVSFDSPPPSLKESAQVFQGAATLFYDFDPALGLVPILPVKMSEADMAAVKTLVGFRVELSSM